MSVAIELGTIREENISLVRPERERPAGCSRIEAVVFPALILASVAVACGGMKLMEITIKSNSTSLLKLGLSMLVIDLGFVGTVTFSVCGLLRCQGDHYSCR